MIDNRESTPIGALTRLGQVMVVSLVVIVEARQRAGDVGRVDVVLARLEQERITAEDGRRAGDLLREAGRQTGDPHRGVQVIGLADGLVAALAERLGGIAHTCDPQHLGWRRDAGARITVVPVPLIPGSRTSGRSRLAGAPLATACRVRAPTSTTRHVFIESGGQHPGESEVRGAKPGRSWCISRLLSRCSR